MHTRSRAVSVRNKPVPGHIATISCVASLLAAFAPARGAWELVPQVDIVADSNDNPRLLTPSQAELAPGSDDAASRLLTRVRLELSTFTSRGEATIEPAVRSDAYADTLHQSLESTDTYFRSNGEYRWQRVLAGYRADFARERILGTEFLNALPVDLDVEDPAVVDSVLVGLNERRRRTILSPYTQIELNERSSLRLESRLIDVAYSNDTVTSRTDFDSKTFGIELIRRLAESRSVGTRVYGSRFRARENNNLTESAGIEVRYAQPVSQTWSFDTAIGVERSDFEFESDAGSTSMGTEDNMTLSLGFTKESDRGRASLDLRRSVSPDSYGFLTARNEFRAILRRDLKPRLRGGLAFRYIDTGELGDAAEVDRDYSRLELDLAWSITELWSLTTAYRHSRRTIETPSEDADSNEISVGFRFRGRSRR